MDEWHVGDPPDWGDSVGVPDIPYMGYINGGDDDDDAPYEVIEDKKSHDEALASEAFDLQKQQRFSEALTLIDRALEISPMNAGHLNIKAIILDNWGRHEDALEYYDKSLDLRNDDVVRGNKAQCLYRIAVKRKASGDYGDALEYVNRALATLPDDFERDRYLRFKGDVLNSLGRNVQARKCYLLASGMFDEIERLEEKQRLIRQSNDTLINIAGRKFYKSNKPLMPGAVVDLIKEPENEHDENAIRVELDGETVGYVGNSSTTVPEGVKSATQIKDMFDSKARAEVMFFFLVHYLISKLI